MGLQRRISRSMVRIMMFLLTGKRSVTEVLNAWFEGSAKNSTIRKIFREAYGQEYAEDVDQNSFISLTMLKSIAEHLQIGKGHIFLDIACGRGGPGLWIVRNTGAGLTGVDISDVALEHAKKRITDFGIENNCRYLVGGLGSIDLPNESHDGAICIDALFMANDLKKTLLDIARILKPGSRFAFTTWEGGTKHPLNVPDHRPLLQNAGFEIEVYQEPVGWEKLQRAVHEGIIREKKTLIKEMGKTAARVWMNDAKTNLKQLHQLRRVLCVAKKN